MDSVAMLWTGFKDRYSASLSSHRMTSTLGTLMPRPCRKHAVEIEAEGPFALTHNDYRLDNMLFGKPGAPKPLAVVDWQTAGKGAPASDVAYFIGAGLTRDDRPKHEQALLRYYHARLQEEGVTDYGFRRAV
jgi:aminoglycoside phosphotransferase (APT) family kinase protein